MSAEDFILGQNLNNQTSPFTSASDDNFIENPYSAEVDCEAIRYVRLWRHVLLQLHTDCVSIKKGKKCYDLQPCDIRNTKVTLHDHEGLKELCELADVNYKAVLDAFKAFN